MDLVDMGLGSTIQPWAAVGRWQTQASAVMAEISTPRMLPSLRRCAACRMNPPAALAARGAERLRARAGCSQATG